MDININESVDDMSEENDDTEGEVMMTKRGEKRMRRESDADLTRMKSKKKWMLIHNSDG